MGPWVESYTTFNECVKLADSSALHKLHTENSSDRPAVPLNISHSLCQLSWHKKGSKRARIEQERVEVVRNEERVSDAITVDWFTNSP